MYTGTQFNWYNQSEFKTENDLSSVDNKPLFMVVSSFDKGPEELMEIYGSNFSNLFGTMSFERHGQNAIQAQRIINAGGKLLLKRVCATDATLANLVLCAKVTSTQTQKTNSAGEKLFLDGSGEETTTDTGNPVYVKNATIKWESSTIAGCKTYEDVVKKATELYDEEDKVYPLFIFTDNGRGVSNKAIRIIPDYNTSKGIGKMFYTVAIYEGTASIETQPITFDPTVIYSNTAYGLDKSTCVQVNGYIDEVIYDSFIAAVAEASDLDASVIKGYDLIYGYTVRGAVINGISIDAESIDLNSNYGIELKEGSNGVFGDKPVNTDAWVQAIVDVYEGKITDEIWDVDQHKVHAVCGANFPVKINEAIAAWASFRKDCVFFRDLGTGLNSFSSIQSAWIEQKTRNYFVADYGTSYQVKDPVTRRNIEVTMMYDFVECLVNHFDAGAFAPLAGTVNGFILKEAIKGTVNFTPIITPTVNQKQAMDDIRVNYAIFEDDQCVVQSVYSADPDYTQLSYVNNVLAIQEVARAVRTACPKNRFTFENTLDMANYAKSVNNVLVNFASNFEELAFEYTQDRLRASQKIFYASIRFKFGTWTQSEIFDLFALSND